MSPTPSVMRLTRASMTDLQLRYGRARLAIPVFAYRQRTNSWIPAKGLVHSSEQFQLLARARRRGEQILPHRRPGLVEAQSLARKFEAAADRPGIDAVTDHAFAPLRFIGLAAAH